MTVAPILSTEALSRRFGTLLAVDKLTLSVRPGEAIALLGRNGSGKTTVIRMLATLLAPTSGSARINGFDIVHEADEVRRAIGYVPQALLADRDLTGYENLLVFARIYNIPEKERDFRINQVLRFMGLDPFANKLVKTYPGDMARRLEIAQSTLHRPRVLFLDEPTLGLDPVARNAILQRVEMLRWNFKSAILLTTHYLDEAARLCDRVAIMNRGRLTALGAIEELAASIGVGKTFYDAFEYYTRDDICAAEVCDETAEARLASAHLS